MTKHVEQFFSLSCFIAITAIVFLSSTTFADLPVDGPIVLPGGTELAEVDFERHVAGLFSRLGCNSAACHGSFQGKGDFRLSLFGQSPEMDYFSTTGELGSHRVKVTAPDDSLILIKATGGDSHGGGLRMTADSWEYQLFRKWIAAGAKRIPDSGAISRLTIEPSEFPLLEVGKTARFRLFAEYADGQRQDVTPFSEVRSRDDAIVISNGLGQVLAKESGDTSLIVSYRGTFLGIPVIVPYAPSESASAVLTANNWIDDHINARLAQLNLTASPLASDAEYLRRISIDLLGIVPTPEEVRHFLASEDSQKRSKAIDSMHRNPRYAALWATKMCDMTACNVDQLGSPEELRPKRARMWHDWFRQRFANNVPYDQIVHGVLCATSRNDQQIESFLVLGLDSDVGCFVGESGSEVLFKIAVAAEVEFLAVGCVVVSQDPDEAFCFEHEVAAAVFIADIRIEESGDF